MYVRFKYTWTSRVCEFQDPTLNPKMTNIIQALAGIRVPSFGQSWHKHFRGARLYEVSSLVDAQAPSLKSGPQSQAHRACWMSAGDTADGKMVSSDEPQPSLGSAYSRSSPLNPNP